jgi:hypothetical protein
MNLLAPELLAEAFITIAPDGTSQAYYSKGLTREQTVLVATAIVNAGIALAQRVGYAMQMHPDAATPLSKEIS